MKKNMLRMLALVLILLPALALADRFAVVTGGKLNLRAYPNANSTSYGKYASGTWVIAGSSRDGWCEVRTLDGKHGYMSANYLSFGQYNGGATVKYANGGYVNLRSGPSLDSGVTLRVTSGSKFYLQGNYNGWCYGYVHSGSQTVYGYMYETFLDTGVSSAVVTTKNGGRVNVRSGPASSYSSVGALATGTQVSVLLKGNNWYMISANGMEGFMSTQYLSGTGDTIGSNAGATTTVTTAYVNNPKSTQVLNLRETPSQSARSIGQYRNGTRVKVVSRGATWCEVYVGTKHGYMMTRYLSFDGHYVQPAYTNAPHYPQQPQYPQYPHYPQYFATPTPAPTQPPVIQYITPVPQQNYPAAPKAGDTVTLTFSAGGGNTINVYSDSALTKLKAAYTANKQAMLLQYGASVCMVYVDGGVAYVSTRNVNY